DEPWATLPESFRQAVIYGAPGFQGAIPFLTALEEKRYKQYIRVFLRQYQSALPCPVCNGTKLRREALWVKVAGRSISEVAQMPINELRSWIEGLKPDAPLAEGEEPPTMIPVPDALYRELRSRAGFLADVGLGDPTLDRQTRTPSG